MLSFKGAQFTKEIILMAVRWYLSYPLSYRHVEELMKERGTAIDHATVNRWVIKYSPQLEKQFRKIKKGLGVSWSMDETYIKIKGKWSYYYRAVDKENNTVDFYLSEKRDAKAARVFLEKAIGSSGVPDRVNIDKSGANLAALESVNEILPWFGLPRYLFAKLNISTISLSKIINLLNVLSSQCWGLSLFLVHKLH